MEEYIKVKEVLRSQFEWDGVEPTINQEELIKDTIKATKVVIGKQYNDIGKLIKENPNPSDLGLIIREVYSN